MMPHVITVKEMRHSAGWSIALGVALVLCGLMAIGSPLVTGIAIELMVGSLIGLCGIVQIVHAVKATTWPSRLVALFSGLLGVICGALMIAHPLAGLSFLTLLLAAYFLVDGVLEIGFSIRLRKLEGWQWILVAGVVTALLGLLIWLQWPLSGAWAVGALVGVNIILLGWGALRLGVTARHQADRMERSQAT